MPDSYYESLKLNDMELLAKCVKNNWYFYKFEKSSKSVGVNITHMKWVHANLPFKKFKILFTMEMIAFENEDDMLTFILAAI